MRIKNLLRRLVVNDRITVIANRSTAR